MVHPTGAVNQPPFPEEAGGTKKKSSNRALVKAIVEKVEVAFVFFSFIIFSDAVLPVILTGGASEGDGFDFSSANYTPLILCRLINYGLTVFFAAFRYKRTIYVLLSDPLAVAANVFMAASFLWSLAPESSFDATISLTFNLLFATYLAGRFTLKQQLTILSYALLSIAFLSIVFVYALPQYGIMGPPVHTGAWRGVFTHKNLAGKVLVLGVGVMFIMFNESKHKITNKWLYLFGILCSFYVIRKTRSGGSLVNFFLIIMVTSMIQVFKAESRKLALGIIFFITGTVFMTLAYVPIMTFMLGLIGKDPTFTGRTDIWEYVNTMISHRPIFGYGIGGFWRGEAGPSLYIWQRAGWRVPNAHHGFLDMVLEIGFLGAAIVVLVLWQVVLRGIARVRLFKTWLSCWPAVYIIFLCVVNLAETSLIAPNSLFWILVTTMSLTTSFEAKYLNDFDRFGLMNEDSPIKDLFAGKIKPSIKASTR